MKLVQSSLRAEHPDTLILSLNLMSIYWDYERFEEAMKLGEIVLAMRKKILRHDHPQILIIMISLANSYYHQE